MYPPGQKSFQNRTEVVKDKKGKERKKKQKTKKQILL